MSRRDRVLLCIAIVVGPVVIAAWAWVLSYRLVATHRHTPFRVVGSTSAGGVDMLIAQQGSEVRWPGGDWQIDGEPYHTVLWVRDRQGAIFGGELFFVFDHWEEIAAENRANVVVKARSRPSAFDRFFGAEPSNEIVFTYDPGAGDLIADSRLSLSWGRCASASVVWPPDVNNFAVLKPPIPAPARAQVAGGGAAQPRLEAEPASIGTRTR